MSQVLEEIEEYREELLDLQDDLNDRCSEKSARMIRRAMIALERKIEALEDQYYREKS